MKFIIFIAPSKTFAKTSTKGSLTPLFFDESKQLELKLRMFTKKQLEEKMHISPALALQVYSYYREETSYRALSLFSGISYREMQAPSLVVPNDKLYIIDAFYGLIRPDDEIKQYRLDFTMGIVGNLYAYWRPHITNYLEQYHKNDILIDLSSKEFSSLLSSNMNVIRIDFSHKDKPINSVLLKKMRGKMTRYLLDHNINSLDALKLVLLDDFKFNPLKSDGNNYIFTND